MEERKVIEHMSYRLCLHQYIDDPKGSEEDLVLEKRSKQTIALNKVNYDISLLGVKFNRRIYQPGEIEAEVDIVFSDDQLPQVPTAKEVSDLFLRRQIELFVVQYDETGQRTNDPPISIAKNYYVYEITPQLSRQANGNLRMWVKLTIFSMDKLMTLDKYSKAYVVKKLGSGILDPESKSFGFGNKLINVDRDHLRLLKYEQQMTISKMSGDVVVQIPSEFIHPYLVQYNETFYDFMARTANRCGEFFYFEDGKLILGLPESKEPYELPRFQTITYQNLSSSPLQVGEYARDSMKDGDGEVGDTNYSPVKKNAAGFPNDAFPTAASYNAEVGNDEFFFPLFADKFTSFAREMGYADSGGDIATQQVFSVLESAASATDGAVGFGISLGMDTAMAHKDGIFNAKDINEEGNTTYISKYVRTEQGDGQKTVLFGSVRPDGWTTLRYYQDVRHYEEEQQKQMICIDMDNMFIPLKLGELIKVKGMSQAFVIVQIKLISDDEWSRNYEKYDLENVSDQYAGKQSMKIFAIPLAEVKNNKGTTDLKPFPPVLPVSPIRKADPQTAFITDNNDPKFQGRVRIVYPWQSMNMPERRALAEAEKTLMEAQQKYDEQKARYDKMDAALKAWKLANLNDQMKQWSKSLKDQEIKDREKNIKSLNSDITFYNELKALLQKEVNLIRGLYEQDGETAAKALKAEVKNLKDAYPDNDAKIKELELKKKPSTDEQTELTRRNTIKKIIKNLTLAADMVENKTQPADVNSILKDFANLLEEDIDNHQATIEEKTNEKKVEEEVKSQLENDKANIDKNEADFKATLDKVEQKDVDDAKKALDKAAQNVATAQSQVDAKAKDYSNKVCTMATPWIRVASPMATEGGGTFFKPMVGDEVLVNFENGNIERPYVVGSLYSKNTLVPDERINRTVGPNLHANASIAIVSPNGHGITFKDPKKGDGFFTSVYPGLGVFNEYAGKIGASIPLPKTKDVTGGIRIGDRYGLYSIDMSSDKRSVKISSSMGTVRLNAFTGITISAPNGDIKIEGKNVSIKAGNNLSLTSGMNINKEVEASSKKGKVQSIVDKVFVTAGSKPVEMFVEPFLDASLFRTVLEVFLKPIEGTMLIKSKRYMKLEAGSGKAMINKDRYKDWTPKKREKMELSQRFFKSMIDTVGLIDSRLSNFKVRYKALWLDAHLKKKAYKEKQEEYFEDNAADIANKLQSQAFGVKTNEEWEKHAFKKADFGNLKPKDKVSNGVIRLAGASDADERKGWLLPAANAFGEAVFTLHKHIDSFLYLFDDLEDPQGSYIRQSLKQAFDFALTKLDYVYELKADGMLDSPAPNDAFTTGIKTFKRQVAAVFMAMVAAHPDHQQDNYIKVGYKPEQVTSKKVVDYYMWNKFVNDMEKWTMHPFLKSLFDSAIDGLSDAVDADGWKGYGDQEVWHDRKGGQILFSDDEDTTVNFDSGALNVENKAKKYNMGRLKQMLVGLTD